MEKSHDIQVNPRMKLTRILSYNCYISSCLTIQKAQMNARKIFYNTATNNHLSVFPFIQINSIYEYLHR